MGHSDIITHIIQPKWPARAKRGGTVCMCCIFIPQPTFIIFTPTLANLSYCPFAPAWKKSTLYCFLSYFDKVCLELHWKLRRKRTIPICTEQIRKECRGKCLVFRFTFKKDDAQDFWWFRFLFLLHIHSHTHIHTHKERQLSHSGIWASNTMYNFLDWRI